MRLLLLLALVSCTNSNNNYSEARAAEQERERTITVTYCEYKSTKTVSAVGGCDAQGNCGTRLSDDTHCILKYPVVGQRLEMCGKTAEKELTQEQYDAESEKGDSWDECLEP